MPAIGIHAGSRNYWGKGALPPIQKKLLNLEHDQTKIYISHFAI